MIDNASVLEMRGVSKRFAGVRALHNVSLSVGRGEVLALIGENGAGKSTLMKILGGVHQPDDGSIAIAGQPVTIQSVADANKAGVAFIHQELNVLDNIDVAGNVFLGRETTRGGPLRLLDRAKMEDATVPFLRRLGLNISPRVSVSSLSIAQQQMVEIAKALSLQAQIIIMDEPTSSLTLTETEKLLEVIRDLRAQNVSVIYISHRLGEVVAVADRVVALRDGQNAGDIAPGEITHDRMVKLMVGRDLQKFIHAADTTPKPFALRCRACGHDAIPTNL